MYDAIEEGNDDGVKVLLVRGGRQADERFISKLWRGAGLEVAPLRIEKSPHLVRHDRGVSRKELVYDFRSFERPTLELFLHDALEVMLLVL